MTDQWTMDSLVQDSQYLDLKVGEGPVEITVEKVEDIPDKKFCLSKSEKDFGGEIGKSPYKVEVTDKETGKRLSVTAWVFVSKLRQVFKEAGKIEGIKIRISRPKEGEYTVEWLNKPETLKEGD